MICLTGSIAMGKSTAAAMLRRWRWPLYDADAAVHRLYGPGGAATNAIAAVFDGVVGPKGVDRIALGRAVFGNPEALAHLEGIVHPLVRAGHQKFFMNAAMAGRRAVVLDIPLLFETKGYRNCDLIVVASAPAFLQRQRALARLGMTPERLAEILRRQTPDAIKRRYADVVALSGLGKRETLRRLAVLRKVGVGSHAC